MPAERTSRLKVTQITMETLQKDRGAADYTSLPPEYGATLPISATKLGTSSPSSEPHIYYPETDIERESFKTKSGKAVPPHHWDVYDFTRTIPHGKVTTYKEVCRAVGGSPRSVGNALRNNPFAPYIPCHRVIASNLFAGGYCGEWGANSKTGTQYFRKLDFLMKEGLTFSTKGVLENSDVALWIP
ncbi:hypothetical protein PQX77_014624 [Marasmius sp. AFHP31]|nr:hypothetical protein PQX77_019060 [Marasmius sp. AFHP31]KAK1222510.1 hypothetical protein PQX77_014624 [Marasmius sp. AFHP31]